MEVLFTSISPLRWSFLGERLGELVFPELCFERRNVKAASLCNQEVLHLLNILKEEPQEQNAPPNSHLATIFYETSHFLQDSGFGEQTSSKINNVLLALKDFPVTLSKEEKLMMINYPPTSNLQLALIVRDADERMTEEQMQDLLNLLKCYLLAENG